MKNMFNNTDLTVFQVIHKLVEHPDWVQIDPAVIKAYMWLMYRTNTRESVIHDLTDADFAAGIGVTEQYIRSPRGIRAKLAEAGLVASAKNPRGLGWQYRVLDPDTGEQIDPEPFDVRKLSSDEITRYYHQRLSDIGMAHDGKHQGQCPFCPHPTHRMTLDFDPEHGTWMCHACSASGPMVEFERRLSKLPRHAQATVEIARYLSRMDKAEVLAAAPTVADAAAVAASGL